MLHVSNASHLSLYDVSRSQARPAPALGRNAQQPTCPEPALHHSRMQMFCGRRHCGQRRPSKLVSRDSASSSTWPSEPAEASKPAEPADESLPSKNGSGVSRKDIEASTDEAATRVGLSSKGSKKIAGFWGAYSKALEEHPIRVKSATSFFGFLAGDAVAQLIVGNPYNYLRTLRMVIFGILMDGPIGHLWYSLLDSKVYPDKPKSNKAVIVKMLCDQLIWAPFFSCVFFAVIKSLEGTPSLIIPTIKAKLIKTLLANYAMWPLAHIINFKFIPSSQRILYINCVQVIWSAYLSNMSSKAM